MLKLFFFACFKRFRLILSFFFCIIAEIEKRLDMFSNTYLMKVFNDKDTSVHGDLWDSLLVFTKRRFIL